jgi:ABC-type Fe3+-siderophore transport system permease subunit
MKFSKIMHVGSAVVGIIGVISFVGAVAGGADNQVFGVTKFDALFCAAILILIATWLQIATIHHILLERKGELV